MTTTIKTFVFICDTDIPYGQPSHGGDRQASRL